MDGKDCQRHRQGIEADFSEILWQICQGMDSNQKDGHWVVHNKKAPGLAHLNENGHAIVRDGKVVGHYKGKKHIKPAEQKAIDKVDELAKQLQQTGV